MNEMPQTPVAKRISNKLSGHRKQSRGEALTPAVLLGPIGVGEALLHCASPQQDETFRVLTQTKEGSFPSLPAPKFTNSVSFKSGLNSLVLSLEPHTK